MTSSAEFLHRWAIPNPQISPKKLLRLGVSPYSTLHISKRLRDSRLLAIASFMHPLRE